MYEEFGSNYHEETFLQKTLAQSNRGFDGLDLNDGRKQSKHDSWDATGSLEKPTSKLMQVQ